MIASAATSRFHTPASKLDPAKAQDQRRVLVLSLAFSVVVHAGIIAIRTVPPEDARKRPLTVRFVKRRPPPVSQAFQLRTRPIPMRRRPMIRRTRRIYARLKSPVRIRGVPARWVEKPWGRVRPERALLDSVTFERPDLEPALPEGRVEIVPFPHAGKIRRKLDMMDLEDLDTGKYHAMVHQNPEDKGEITGFFHVVNVYLASQDLARAHFAQRKGLTRPPPRGSGLALPNLVRAMNEFTGIKADIIGTISVESPELLKAPWAMFAGQAPFEPSRAEAASLGRYLRVGGFIFLDTEGLGLGPLRNLLHVSLASQNLRFNRHWELVGIGPKHPIFDSYFQLPGLPLTANPWLIDPQTGTYLNTRRAPLVGVEIGGRLAALATTWGHSALWAYHDSEIPPPDANEEVRHAGYLRWSTAQGSLKFGVNLLVYVLTQPGSITDQVMRKVFF